MIVEMLESNEETMQNMSYKCVTTIRTDHDMRLSERGAEIER